IGLADFRGANILENNVEDLFLSHSFRQVRSRVVEAIEGCQECIYRNICGAPFPAEVFSMTGNENTISPYCEFYKKIIEDAFRLIAKGKVRDLLRDELLENMEFEYHI
ncbi:MAG: peptide-modifying radical SAM enzyme CbpB, partial [Thermodesulfobacteriota bacterium]